MQQLLYILTRLAFYDNMSINNLLIMKGAAYVYRRKRQYIFNV